MTIAKNYWKEGSKVFDERAAEYDGWFDGSLVYRMERQALADLKTPFKPQKIEIGVGPGRFAKDLGVEFGIDPAMSALRIAQKRGISVINATIEHLPVKSSHFETVYLLLTLCFLQNPAAGIRQIRRIIKPGGHLVIGMINKESSWGQALIRKKQNGHPFYIHANFFTPAQAATWLTDAGFTIAETASSLLQPPEALTAPEKTVAALNPQAGFIILVGRKN